MFKKLTLMNNETFQKMQDLSNRLKLYFDLNSNYEREGNCIKTETSLVEFKKDKIKYLASFINLLSIVFWCFNTNYKS